MARLASQASAGFYPAAPRVVTAVARHLAAAAERAGQQVGRRGGRTARLLDPCAGTGEAAAEIADALGAESFGIELHAERATACRARLGHVLATSAFTVRLANGAFSCLWLNPPYDYDDAQRRAEHAFLTTMTRALAPGGLLVFLIPQRRLATSARYLASHYGGFHAYRFPDPEFGAFGQMVLFATKKRQAVLDAAAQTALERWSGDELPALPDEPDPDSPLLGVRVPALPAGEVLFSSLFFDASQAAGEARRRGAWVQPQLTEQLWPDDERLVRPLMPLRRGHLALLIAAGFLDNIVLAQDDDRVLVKGRTRKVFVPVETDDPDTVVEREVIRASVVVLDLRTGALELVEQGRGDPPPASSSEGAARSRPPQSNGKAVASGPNGHEAHGTAPLTLPIGPGLVEFLDRFKSAIADAVIRAYPPLYGAEARRRCGFDMGRLLRRPLGAQGDAIRAAALSLKLHGSAIVVGEMGTGKTLIAAAAAYFSDLRRVFVLCPPHLVRKWRREVLKTVPGCEATIVRRITDLVRCRDVIARSTQSTQSARSPGASPAVHFVICSREPAKLGYRWMPAAVLRPVRAEGGALVLLRDDSGQIVRQVCCPSCFAPARDDEGVPLSLADLRAKKRWCRVCGGALWQADHSGPRRFPLADYVRRHMRGFFSLLIVDEIQEYKARGSGQGLAAATLAEACDKTLCLTGTLFGGYASTLFYLLWRFSRGAASIRTTFSYKDETRWVLRYGVVERITKIDPDERIDDGRRSKRRVYLTRTVEKPGVSPAILFHLIANTVFLRLSDVAEGLPPYTEGVHLLPLDRTETPVDPVATFRAGLAAGPDAGPIVLSGPSGSLPVLSQAACYQRLAGELQHAVRQALRNGSKRLLSTYLQVLLAYPDACTHAETVVDAVSGKLLAHAPALPADRLYPKEQRLVEWVRRERARGRRVLCYITHTDLRDLSPRLQHVLGREGFRVAVLKASTVPPERREDWIARRAQEGTDVLLANPRLVQTGLDLIEWPTLIWYEPEFSVYVMRQASRRSWRPGQRLPVEVPYFAYGGTMQARALALAAAKLRSALVVEGELPEDGLAALEGDDQDTLLALARQLVAEDSTLGAVDTHSLEALFAAARREEREGDAYLVAGSWDDDGAVPKSDDRLAVGLVLAGTADTAGMEGMDGTPTSGVWQQPLALDVLPLAQSRSAPHDDHPGVSNESGARVISFDELARLTRLAARPRRGQRAIPAGQLTLLSA